MDQERAQLEARVRELESRLLQADKLACIGQMSAGIAHEINNPAAYVLANLTALADLFDELESLPLGEAGYQAVTSAREIVTDCLAGVDRIRQIANDLKIFVRLDNDQITRVQLGPLIEGAVKLAQNELRHRARIRLSLTDVSPILGEAGKLTQVVLNLLINAAQAIEGGDASRHEIEIRTLQDGERVLLEVRDTGRGIPAENLTRIFEPFFTTKERGSGTGLGLWLTREIVRQHEGEIAVESQLGVGTTFRISLPAQLSSRRSLEPKSEVGPTFSLPLRKGGRVLLIDDDPIFRRAIRRMLSQHHTIVEAESGAHGIEMLDDGEIFDAVLCDLMMPDIDGITIYEHVAEHRPSLLPKLSFMSGGAFTERARTFLHEVSAQVIEKPVSRDALLRVLDGLIEADRQLMRAAAQKSAEPGP